MKQAEVMSCPPYYQLDFFPIFADISPSLKNFFFYPFYSHFTLPKNECQFLSMKGMKIDGNSKWPKVEINLLRFTIYEGRDQ